MSKIDLHTHSSFSDGTSTPEEVVCDALKAGVSMLALSDHDITDGVTQAQQICQAHNLPFISAVEISTREHDHLHFLGYGVNINDASFQAFLAQNRQKRRTRICKIISKLQQAGLEITEEEVFARAPHTVSRAHVADLLKAKKIVPTRQEGFRKYLMPEKVGYVRSAGVSALEAITQIKRAGGIAVIAHPGMVSAHWDFPKWVEAGLTGIEVFYPAHTYSLKQDLLAIARKYGLFCTGGSDFHGPRAGRIARPGVYIPQDHYNRLQHIFFNK